MFEKSTFGKTMDIIGRSMSAATLRREVISNNLANSEVPNFKRTNVSFEAELGKALASEQQPGVPFNTPDSRHIHFSNPTDYRTVRPRRTLDYLTESKNNGNNVDPESEAYDMTINQMRYEVMAEAMRAGFSRINSLLR